MTRGINEDKKQTFGRYEIVRQLGKGGMGTVYLAEDPVLQREIALKVINLDDHISEARKADYLRRFQIEARASARLKHSSIVTVYDVGEEQGIPWIAFEFVDGPSLDSLLEQEGKIPVSQAVSIVVQIAAALEVAHRHNIIHRDIKPANILLDKHSNTAKLTDFGIAKAPGNELTQEGITLGSPGYMSPEQLTGHALTESSDLFSLGVVFYEAITGRHPFRGETFEQTAMAILTGNYTPLGEFFDQVAPEIDYTIAKCLTADSQARVQSAADIISMLSQYQDPSASTRAVPQVTTHYRETDMEGTDTQGATIIGAPHPVSREQMDTAAWYSTVSSFLRGMRARLPFLRDYFFSSIERLLAWIDGNKRKSATILFVVILCVTGLVWSLRDEQSPTPGIPTFDRDGQRIIDSHQHDDDSARADRDGMDDHQRDLIHQGQESLRENNLEKAQIIADMLESQKSISLPGNILLLRVAIRSQKIEEAKTIVEGITALNGGDETLLRAKGQLMVDVLPVVRQSKISPRLLDFLVDTLQVAHEPVIQTWIRDVNYWLRWNAVEICTKADLPVDLVNVYILDLQNAGSWQTRRAAAVKLGELKDKRAIPALREARSRGLKDPIVSGAARSVLEKHFK